MKFVKFSPNDYVMVVRSGNVVKEGIGLSLFYNEMTTNIMVAPSTAFDGSFAFDDLVTSDYQRVCVQGVTTYMLTDYKKATQMLDFAYDSKIPIQGKIADTMALLEKRINNIIKAIVIREVSKKDVRTIIRLADEMAASVADKLSQDESIAKLGVSIVGVNILGINPNVETRKALEAAAREQILKEQDDAIYMRRNAAIEQERVIKENEINTEIKVAEKEREKEEKQQEMRQYLVRCDMNLKKEQQEKDLELKQRTAAKMLQIENEEKLGRIELENQEMLGKIELEKKNKEFTVLEVENAKLKADQEAQALEGIVKAYNNLNVALVEACAMAQMDPGTLMAKGFMNIGENADKIGTFNLTPDLLQTIATGIGQGMKK
ncbi:MAG: SPFH domain-containing protein [Butyrivibrio sp.]|nr:SPFH domain-containing protein [Butyrivibrio sp.]